MSKITRCPHCLESVYASAKICPHCEKDLNHSGGRIFTRGAVIFILLALVGWTVTDTISILHEKQQRERRRAEDLRVEVTLRTLFESSDLSDYPAVKSSIEKFRTEHDQIFPAQIVDTVYVTRAGVERLEQTHVGFVRSHFEARRYRFSALVSRGGQWFGITGTLGIRNVDTPVLFESYRILEYGGRRPGWNGNRHLEEVAFE